jgi:hypothetical protein
MASDAEKESIIHKAKEPLLTMSFLKADNSFRVMNFRLDVPGNRGGKMKYVPSEKGAILVYDMNCRRTKSNPCHRTVYLNKIVWIMADGVLYDFRKNRKVIPKDMKDLYNNKGKMKVETGDDPIEKGVVLTEPKKKKSASFYEFFKISHMSISFRKI